MAVGDSTFVPVTASTSVREAELAAKEIRDLLRDSRRTVREKEIRELLLDSRRTVTGSRSWKLGSQGLAVSELYPETGRPFLFIQ
jgi:hypothetical protein